MKQHRNELPTRLGAGGVCIQANDWADWNVARIRFPKGADAAPLLQGLPQNLCQCPHWGTVLRGIIDVRYADGTTETVRAGDVYYWPPGHTVSVQEDYEAIEFSPSEPMGEVIEHLRSKLAAS
ncbi:MAG TPA: cupin domain-containing protein [Candidatus Binatia bacterium]|nr:cupin domain-containing protein [Candidatus Binatia bacterium]